MTPDEFVRRAVGVPWERWRSDWQAMDCFGCIVLYFREVLGVDLGPVPQTDIATGFDAAPGWQQCEAEAGATCFMAWRAGAPTHCGVILAGDMLLHAEGSIERGGSVKVTRLAVMRRLNPDIRFYRYAAPC